MEYHLGSYFTVTAFGLGATRNDAGERIQHSPADRNTFNLAVFIDIDIEPNHHLSALNILNNINQPEPCMEEFNQEVINSLLGDAIIDHYSTINFDEIEVDASGYIYDMLISTYHKYLRLGLIDEAEDEDQKIEIIRKYIGMKYICAITTTHNI